MIGNTSDPENYSIFILIEEKNQYNFYLKLTNNDKLAHLCDNCSETLNREISYFRTKDSNSFEDTF